MRAWLPSPAARVRAQRPEVLADLVETLASGQDLAPTEREVLQVLLRERPGVERERERRRAVRLVYQLRVEEPATSFRQAADLAARRLGGRPETIRKWVAEALSSTQDPVDVGANQREGDR